MIDVRTASEDELRELLQDVQVALQGLSDVSLRELEEVARRLERRDYLVAVFGAFSAGKSSLLNALLGDSILAVSPNPTTASVTQLQGTDEAGKNIVVTAKTQEELWRDVSSAFTALHEYPSELTEAISRGQALNAKNYPTSLRRHVRFIKAICEGYGEMQARLGTKWTTTLDELKSFSAIEHYAAYVAKVDVHEDDPWLRKGFIFVDTPGVDSIHRRHTDVAFRYMRHADAVIFVMYYTHAFTQGDRDFLLQLAGVQDVAKTNKLFAVINAVDLAKSVDEREAVRARVEQELRKLGIRTPRVYEVSAQLGLAARRLAETPEDAMYAQMARTRLQLEGEAPLPAPDELFAASGLRALEDDLTDYVESEGHQLARDMVWRALQQVKAQIDHLVHDETARQSDDEMYRAKRQVELAQLEASLTEVRRRDDDRSASLLGQYARDLDELVFHAGERIRLRYRDLFREAFHPGRFRVGRPQEKLREASEELCEALARQIDIETRTLSLRAVSLAEATVERIAVEWRETFEQHGVSVPIVERFDFSSAVVESVQSSVPADTFRPYHRHFSSTKQFFEEGGQRAMLDESELAVMEAVKAGVVRATGDVTEHAVTLLQQAVAGVYQAFFAQLRTVEEAASRPFDARRLQALVEAEEYMNKLVGC
ncbi:dynamin family protein [Alicyclobacillus fastidiosus]|uniref:Dynamin family protein n=1 Tax=Alicyclobacillus fastidiosus TaxID=392011 RepID=A0ABV5ADI8_9BACL|nr:dynamin family protein [Alicyclobacillus fastidiosus]WEH08646.1 dynamin family protein [Alicyclobacillus fastidiosus]